MRLLKLFVILSFTLLFAAACQPAPKSASEPSSSRESRAALGAAAEIDAGLLGSLEENLLLSDWKGQDAAGQGLWHELNQKVERHGISFAKWQTWYSQAELQRVFRIAYQTIGVDARKERRDFSLREIEAAIDYHDQGQFREAAWDLDAYQRWLERFEGPDEIQAIPGLNKVLMNRAALVTLLANYRAIDTCYRLQGQTTPCKDIQIRFPRGAAFIKTAWRRGQEQGDFTVPRFLTDDLAVQLSGDAWLSAESGIPVTKDALRMATPTNQIFHLVGVHVTLKLDRSWFWSTHWLDEQRPEASYRSCAVMGFQPLASGGAGGFEAEVARAEALTGQSWCSNPYLETGPNNHKTNCIGCHQHAGTPWADDDFRLRLESDLGILLRDARIASRSDQVWSLWNGPEPLASFITQEIDYFDVYDI